MSTSRLSSTIFQRDCILRGESDEPVALETELGFVLSGPLKGSRLNGNEGTLTNFVAGEPIIGGVAQNGANVRLDDVANRLWDWIAWVLNRRMRFTRSLGITLTLTV